MFATGRAPNVDGPGLEKAGVDDRRPTAASRSMRHRAPACADIYAVGDVTNRVNLTPVAIREGHAFADSVFGKQPWATSYDMVPTAVFSTPGDRHRRA